METDSIVGLRSRLERVSGRRDDVVRRLGLAEAEVRRLVDEEELAALSAALIRKMIDAEIIEGVKAVELLLSEGLAHVFDDQDLSVKAVVDEQRGKVSVDLVTVQKHPDGTVTEGISRDVFGGAVTTVQSVLLRILVTLQRGLRPFFVLDESLPAFDANYVHNMGEFLRSVCSRLGVDILLVTHNSAMLEAAGRAYRIVNTNGTATFRRIR